MNAVASAHLWEAALGESPVRRGGTPRRGRPRPERSAAVPAEARTAETVTERVVRRVLKRKGRLLAFLEERLGNRTDAEDVLQTAMLRLVAKQRSLRQEDHVVQWFQRVLRNLVVDWYRRRATRTRLLARLARLEEGGTHWDEEFDHQVCRCVHDILAMLKPDYAEILRQVELDERSLAEAARRLRITRGNASVRLHRARHALLEGLQATCGACFDHGCLDCYCRKPAQGGRAPPFARSGTQL
jgi:RNA polymerase sigma factor (sigma-70 family)